MSWQHEDLIEKTIENLRLERCNYMARVEALAAQGRADVEAEIRGYLRCIENINNAMIRLARSIGVDDGFSIRHVSGSEQSVPLAA
jgi:hypothetical protein